MTAEDNRTENVLVRLEDGTEVLFEATVIGEEDVAFTELAFGKVTEQIQAVSHSIVTALQGAAPSRAAVEFGVEVSTGTGGLTAVFVKGTAKANLKITLEWSHNPGESYRHE